MMFPSSPPTFTSRRLVAVTRSGQMIRTMTQWPRYALSQAYANGPMSRTAAQLTRNAVSPAIGNAFPPGLGLGQTNG